jgi:hypothetical protein
LEKWLILGVGQETHKRLAHLAETDFKEVLPSLTNRTKPKPKHNEGVCPRDKGANSKNSPWPKMEHFEQEKK